jgi:hypothetical protein
MLHLRAAMGGFEAARETIRSHQPDRVLGWVVLLSASQVASGNYAAATATTSFTVAAVPVTPAGFYAHHSGRLQPDIGLAPGQLKPTR